MGRDWSVVMVAVDSGRRRGLGVALVLCGVLVAGSVLSGCYRRTIRAEGIGASSGRTISQPNSPEPGTPLFPWWNGGDDEDEDDR